MADTRCNVEQIASAFIESVQYLNPVIANKARTTKGIYRSLVGRGTFNYGEGYVKKSYTFHGGVNVQDAGASWSAMGKYRAPGTLNENDPGYDPCKYQSEIIRGGFEAKEYTVYQASRRTEDICLTDILFDWQFQKQLELWIGALANVTLAEWEQITREASFTFSTKYMAQKGTNNIGFTPFTMAAFDDEIDIPATGLASIGYLNQTMLDRVYSFMARQLPEGAIGVENGMPVFTLVTSPETSQEVITKDPQAVQNMQFANPSFLIEGYGTALRYKHFAHLHSMETPRFVVNATGTKLVRVWPWLSTPTTIGEAFNINPEYVNAPFELSHILPRDVFQMNVPPANPANVGGADFDPADCMGDFSFENIKDRCENIRREKGFFFGVYRMAPEPLANSGEAVLLLHRRCDGLTVDNCVACSAGTTRTVSSIAKAISTEADSVATLYDVVLSGCIQADIGQMVEVTFASGDPAHGFVVKADEDNATYRLAFNTPRASGYNNPAMSTVVKHA